MSDAQTRSPREATGAEVLQGCGLSGLRRSTQAEIAQNEHYNHDKADKVYDLVHRFPAPSETSE